MKNNITVKTACRVMMLEHAAPIYIIRCMDRQFTAGTVVQETAIARFQAAGKGSVCPQGSRVNLEGAVEKTMSVADKKFYNYNSKIL